MSVKSGRVLSFKMTDATHGYGFIEADSDDPDEPNVYFNLAAARYSPIMRGDRVDYSIATRISASSFRGPRAHKVEKIEGNEI